MTIPSPKSIGGAIWQIARFKAPRGATLEQICLHCGAQNAILRYEFYEFKIGEGIVYPKQKMSIASLCEGKPGG